MNPVDVHEIRPAVAPPRVAPRPTLVALPAPAVPRRLADKLSLAVMIACLCLFAAVFVAFVVYPALNDMSGTPSSSWNAEGP